MTMSNEKSRTPTVATVDQAAQALIVLIDEFIAVVREENAMLARGLPAALSSVAGRKAELAGAFEMWVKAATERAFRIDMASDPVRTRFVERLTLFQATMNDNIAHLEAAMEASRRRIEAVMTAIRNEMVEASPYGANGRTYQLASQTAMRSGTYL